MIDSHERPMHLIAVRRDLAGFQQITPGQGEGASWWAVLNLTPGPWHDEAKQDELVGALVEIWDRLEMRQAA